MPATNPVTAARDTAVARLKKKKKLEEQIKKAKAARMKEYFKRKGMTPWGDIPGQPQIQSGYTPGSAGGSKLEPGFGVYKQPVSAISSAYPSLHVDVSKYTTLKKKKMMWANQAPMRTWL